MQQAGEKRQGGSNNGHNGQIMHISTDTRTPLPSHISYFP